jgi:hypothetical protein
VTDERDRSLEILSTLKSLERTLDDHVVETRKRLDTVTDTLHSPNAGSPGLVVRVDRLEQLVRSARTMAGAVAGVVGMAGAWLAHALGLTGKG